MYLKKDPQLGEHSFETTMFANRRSKMEAYQLEVALVEQRNNLHQIRDYVEGEALNDKLHEVEENLFRMLLSYGQNLLKEVVARHGDGRSKSPVVNNDEEIVRYHSHKSREYLSIFGLLEMRRAYYWRKGSKGVFPLDKKLNLPQHQYSYLLLKWTHGRIASDPYDEAVESMNEILNLSLHKQGQEEASKTVAANVRKYYQEEDKIVPSSEGEILVATADCKGVPMVPSERSEQPKASKVRRGKGDKKKGLCRDAVVTSDYSFQPSPRTAFDVIDGLMSVNGQKEQKNTEKVSRERVPQNKRIFASMSGKEAAFKELADRLHQRDPGDIKKIFILFDGERALQTRVLEEFYSRGWEDRIAGMGLDIVHAMEYLWEAGSAIHGEKSAERVLWVRRKGIALLEGKVGRVIGSLRQILAKRTTMKKSRQKILQKVITYFENHRHMMRYDEYLRRGYPVATGVIEGACGCLVKDRTCCSGMKWTCKGVQAVLDLRAIKQNGDWEEYWTYHIKQEHERLYKISKEKMAA